VRDINNDGFKEFAVSRTLGDDLSVWILDKDLAPLKRFQRTGKIYNGRPDSGMSAVLVTDINRDGKKELIAKVGTGYGWTPRGVSVFDFDTGGMLWHWETGPGVTELMLHDNPATGDKMLCFGSYSPGNGYRESKGTDDFHSYLWMLDHSGQALWQKTVGEHFTGSYVQFVDLDHDGKDEVLAYMNTAYEYRDTDNGNVYILDINGEVRHHYPNDLSVKGVCIVPSYETKTSNLLLSLREGRLVLLDAKLAPLKTLTLPNESGKVAMPIIKGILNTYYGEFVAIFSYEEDRIVKNPRGDRGPKNVTVYHNVKLLLLDRKTLAVRFEHTFGKRMDDLTPTKIEICDTDADGQDDILVFRKDGIEVLKLTQPSAANVAQGQPE
jgi:hypothetical protein